MPSIHETNVNNLTELTTVIKGIEGYENGIIGKAEYQYIQLVTKHDGNISKIFQLSTISTLTKT